jgi:hypothetical protein
MPGAPRPAVLACTAALVAGAAGAACAQRTGSAGTPNGAAPAVPSTTPAAGAVVEEARAFMDAYARDLRAGDRAAIAARYDRTGTYFLGNGGKEFSPHDSIVARYAGAGWAPPASFEWRDLSFESVGPDAVVVAGRLLWGGRSGAAPMALSYTALLRRQDGVLRIRLEDESTDPRSLPAPPARRDSARP